MRLGFMPSLSGPRLPPRQTWHRRPGSHSDRDRIRKCFSQLLRYPGGRLVFRDVEMKDPASTVFDNEETVQDSKGESGHREEVHGRAPVIAQESSPEFPCLLGRRQALDIARNCPFRDLEAEFERLTMNSGSAPGGILFHHPLDENSNLGIDLWPAKALGPRLKAPEQPKASPMPGDNGFWFDNNQDVAPCRPKAAEQNPKYSILDCSRG